MAKKNQEELVAPKLIIPRVEAKEKLQAQIIKGKELLNSKVNSENEFDILDADFKKWNGFNSELLMRIFENKYYSEKYNWTAAFGFIRTTRTAWHDIINNLRESIQKKITSIETLIETIDLIPAPEGNNINITSNNSISSEAAKKIKLIPLSYLNNDPDVDTIFIDIVGFSKKTHEQRLEIIKKMNQIVIDQIIDTANDNDYFLLIPTGDGLAISMITLTATLSIVIASKIRADFRSNTIPARIGLNKSRDTIIKDVNENINISGPGIIGAQRIMDFGSNYSIYISETIYMAIKDRIDNSYFSGKKEEKDKHGNAWTYYSYEG